MYCIYHMIYGISYTWQGWDQMQTQFQSQFYPSVHHYLRFSIMNFYIHGIPAKIKNQERRSRWVVCLIIKTVTKITLFNTWKSFLFANSCLHLDIPDHTPLHYAQTLNVNRILQDWNISLARHKSFPKFWLSQILSFDKRNNQNLIRTRMGYFGQWWLIWNHRLLNFLF